jgi:gentisate 1,2-dioxygenase
MTTARTNDSLELLHADLAQANMAPTWVYVSEFVAASPRVSYRPWLWRWDNVIPLLMRAGDLITPDRGAERRSMEHVNPDLKQYYCTSHTLATAFQLVRAGERAPSHRHAAAAIRFAARSHGGDVYTQVQGEKLLMEENDLLLTPSWTWHEHANNTLHDIVWLDALDFPLVNLMQTSVFEPGHSTPPNEDADNLSDFRDGLYRPAEWSLHSQPKPVMRYPWREMSEALGRLHNEAGSPFDDIILEYVNPANSGSTLPTMSCRSQLLRRGKHTRAHRATSSTVYFVIAGHGASIIEGVRHDWGRGDVFVVPNWRWHEHVAGDQNCYLFSITDQPVVSMLGLYREEPLSDNDGRQSVTGVFQG